MRDNEKVPKSHKRLKEKYFQNELVPKFSTKSRHG
jgi:hypothetical protein